MSTKDDQNQKMIDLILTGEYKYSPNGSEVITLLPGRRTVPERFARKIMKAKLGHKPETASMSYIKKKLKLFKNNSNKKKPENNKAMTPSHNK